MAVNPSPDPGGWDSLMLEVSVDVDAEAWSELDMNLADFCRALARSSFDQVQKTYTFESQGADHAELAIWLTSDARLRALNLQYRGLDKPTNVLSFAALDGSGPTLPAGAPLALGDIAIAAETVLAEARSQGKTAADHLAHMVVHGTLHVLGFDHQEDEEAREMEALERDILRAAGVADPYLYQDTHDEPS